MALCLTERKELVCARTTHSHDRYASFKNQNIMAWTDNEILNQTNPNQSCEEIFKAVCNEIGNHYENKGFKYSKSRPKISYQDKELKVEIAFWSSRSNIPGEYVNLEIVPGFYSKAVIKNGLSTINAKAAKGLIVSSASLFNQKLEETTNTGKLIQIFGDAIPQESRAEISFNNSCNIYNINKERFEKIIEFIDSRIIYWIEKIKTEDGINELIHYTSKKGIESLKGKNTNSDFIPYCKATFESIDIESLMKKM